MSFGIEGLHMCITEHYLLQAKLNFKLFEGKNKIRIWPKETSWRMWRSRMQRPCSHKSLSNQRTTWSGKRKGEECRSGDGHLEWPPGIVEFIHSRNVFQKEVITFSKLWEEEEARFIRREGKMEETEDQALMIQRRSLKEWGIWRTQLLKNFLSTHLDKKWCYHEWRRWWSWRLKKEYTHETNKR